MLAVVFAETIVCERIFAVWAFRTYEEVRELRYRYDKSSISQSNEKFPIVCLFVIIGEVAIITIFRGLVVSGFHFLNTHCLKSTLSGIFRKTLYLQTMLICAVFTVPVRFPIHYHNFQIFFLFFSCFYSTLFTLQGMQSE